MNAKIAARRLVLTLLVVPLLLAATGDDAAVKLADAVVKASGGDQWQKVKRLQFTFNVEQDGKVVLSAIHDWDVRGGTDRVRWGDREKPVAVRVNQPPGEGADADAKEAFKRWTNDSYWLLAPLKLKDGGVVLANKGTQEVEGQTYEVLHVSFENVGMTPGDQYNLYVDPQAKLVRRWDYMPSPDKKTTATWDAYKSFGPLALSTEHQMGPRRIFFTDVAVEAE